MNFFLSFCFTLLLTVVFSQKKHHLILHASKKNVQYNAFKDSAQMTAHIQIYYHQLVKDGYISSFIDSSFVNKDTLHVFFKQGPIFKECIISITENLSHKGKLILSNQERQMKPRELSEFLRETLLKYTSNGYPFAEVSLKDIEISTENKIRGQLDIVPHNQYYWTDIKLKGNSGISNDFIQTILGIEKNTIYNNNQEKDINQRIGQIAFIESEKPYELLFTDKEVTLYLYLKTKPVNTASGIVGLVSNPITSKYTLTGDVQLKLQNVLNRSENIDIQWRNLQAGTQTLKSNLLFPVLFKMPIGINGQFLLYKRDSTFLELKTTLGINYILRSGFTVKFHYQYYQTSILKTINLASSSLANSTTKFYGFSLKKQTIDFIPSPRKGYIVSIDASIGQRKTDKNTSTTQKTEINYQQFIPIFSRHICAIRHQTEFYIAPDYFQNELLRFGGQQTQRGFREDEFNATTRILNSVEYRFLLDKTSYLFLFYDQTWYENKMGTQKRAHPFGFGSGISLGTTNGNFVLAYGLGKRNELPIELKNGTIHIGFITYF